jgi:phospholipase/carboxylesterase
MRNPATQLIDANDPVVEATGLVYRVRRGAVRSPLVVMLHGLGGDEDAMWVFGRAIPDRYTVISPRAPIKIDPGAPYADVQRVEGGYSWLRPAPPLDPDRSTFTYSLELLRRFIEAAIGVYEIDRRNVIVMGFSQGAAMSYALALIEPELIAGVIALAGFMPEFERPAHVRGSAGASVGRLASTALHSAQGARTPRHGYLIIHGIDDQSVPILYAHQARDRLRSWGAPVEYHAYSIGHKVTTQGMRDITNWLKEKSEARI